MTSVISPASEGGIDDVIIVGAGLAGLICALRMSPRPVTVLGGIPIAAGGASTRTEAGSADGSTPDLRIDTWLAETLAAGAGLAEARVVRSVLGDWQRCLGEVARRHGVGGSDSGPALHNALLRAVRQTPSIRVLECFVAEQLRSEDRSIAGLVARDRRGGGLSNRLLFPARAVVLASGGIGDLYEHTSNPATARGEGLGMAARAGALIADAEFVEFLPADDGPAARRANGRPARAAHFHIGGVHVDGRGRTSIDGLWACGEVAATGMHGAGCIASNAPVEAMVGATRVAEDILGVHPKPRVTPWKGAAESNVPAVEDEDGDVLKALRATMTRHVGPVRNRAGLTEALAAIAHLSERTRSPQVRNALVAAKLVATSALRREESRGVHVRSDFPTADQNQATRTFLTLGDAGAAVETALAPLELAS